VAAAQSWNEQIIEEFRSNGGKVGGRFEKQPLLLLHHKGARSGTGRVNPLAYQKVGDAFAVFASKGGAPSNPDWYYNLLENPRARVEVGTETFDVNARVATPEEREGIWSKQIELNPGFAGYEERTEREIPVVILERA
jgi:deazaflavin-dependent oxidoreductase (nitroreductase family)